jgi:methyl-accepting chemotaxis protein
MITTWTIRRRLLLGFGFLTAVLFLAGVVGIRALTGVHDEMEHHVREVTDVGDRLLLASDATLRYVALAQSDIMEGTAANAARLDHLSALADSMRRTLIMGTSLGSAAERARLEEIGAMQGRLEVYLAGAQAYRDIGRTADAMRMASQSTPLLDSIFTLTSELYDDQTARTHAMLAEIASLVATRRALLVGLLLFGVAAAIGFGVVTWRAVVRPLGRLTAAAESLGRGDLTQQFGGMRLDQEYRVLVDAFGDTIARLRNLVTTIQDEATSLNVAAESLQFSSDQTAHSTEQISEVLTGIAQEAEEQRTVLQDSAQTLASVAESADALAASATASRDLGREIHDTAHRTRVEIDQALATLERAQAVIGASADSVARIDEVTGAVEQFVSAVAGIARQTNLLALNAAIEAARAGEHGRGFAVVADEVRKLATQSAQAAQEVGQVVGTMRQQVASAVSEFRKGTSELGDVSTISRTATAALDGIETAVARVGEVTGSVENAARASRGAVHALLGQVENVAERTESQAAASEEAAAAAEETAASSHEVSSTAEQLAGSASRLRTLISSFRV